MAPRRSVRSATALHNNNNYSNLTINDVLCPICRSVLLEPVTLPCNHSFCSSCFDGTIANANLVCPLCRVRIGSWLRRTSKKDSLINVALWNAIQKTFPKQVKNKRDGIEEDTAEDIPRRLNAPGEIREEYEAQRARELAESQQRHAKEEEASVSLIKKLKEEEEYEECVRDENRRLSEQVAKKLAEEYSFDPGPSCSKTSIKLVTKVPQQKQLEIDGLLRNMKATNTKEYTCKILCQGRNKEGNMDKPNSLKWKMKDKLKRLTTENEASDSNDSITSECRYFKPIDQKNIPLSLKIPIVKVPGIIIMANTVLIGPPKGEMNFKHSAVGSAFATVKIQAYPILEAAVPSTSRGNSSPKKVKTPPKRGKKVPDKNCNFVTPSKRKRSTEEDEQSFYGYNNANLKDLKEKTNGYFNSNFDSDRQEELKKLQEEEDLKFALKLQEELNSRGRYSTRNSINLQKSNGNVKKTKRQVTLTEMMGQTANKVP